MSGWFKGIELSAFKQVDGGYVFRVPNAWFFGPARHYLVNETQRSAIAERLRQIRCGLLPLTFVAAVFMIMLVMFVAVSIQPQGPMRSIALVVLATAALVPTIATAHIYRMHKLAPLIAELPRSSERITLRDRFRLQAANVSATNAAGWYDLSFPTPLNLAAGSYWIGVITGETAKVARFRYDSVAGSRDYNANTYTSGPSNPFGSVSTDSVQTSLYATYTTAEGDTTPPTQPQGLIATAVGPTRVDLSWP